MVDKYIITTTIRTGIDKEKYITYDVIEILTNRVVAVCLCQDRTRALKEELEKGYIY